MGNATLVNTGERLYGFHQAVVIVEAVSLPGLELLLKEQAVFFFKR